MRCSAKFFHINLTRIMTSVPSSGVYTVPESGRGGREDSDSWPGYNSGVGRPSKNNNSTKHKKIQLNHKQLKTKT